MFRSLVVWSAAATVLSSAAYAASEPGYGLVDYGNGLHNDGVHTGAYRFSDANGDLAARVAGGFDPTVEASGSTVAGRSAYLDASAIYTYHINLTASSDGVGEALLNASASQGVSQVVGYLSGFLNVDSTFSSQVIASLFAGGYRSADNVYASCAGYLCYSAVPGFARNTSVPFTLLVHLNDFDFACAHNPNTGAVEGDCTKASTRVVARAEATLRNEADLSAGSGFASLDPTFTLNPNFLRDNGLGPHDVTISQDSISAVPEPASWAMMLTGFALLGARRRRSRESGSPAEHSLRVYKRLTCRSANFLLDCSDRIMQSMGECLAHPTHPPRLPSTKPLPAPNRGGMRWIGLVGRGWRWLGGSPRANRLRLRGASGSMIRRARSR